MGQGVLFGPDDAPTAKPPGDTWTHMRVLITVKAAPNPSATYGETVCVAGIRLDLGQPGWVRLYPINFRELEQGNTFAKYDVVSLRVKPARQDGRVESWRPDVTSVHREGHLKPWNSRRSHVEPYIEESMCDLLSAVRADKHARSLAVVKPTQVLGVDIRPHPGWSAEDQYKIDQYVNQLDLTGTDRTALQAPRFQGWYRYRCTSAACREHRQGILDWEFVALQRNLSRLSDHAAIDALRETFFRKMCGPDRDTAFYVGNQAKRTQIFSVLGVYWPPR